MTTLEIVLAVACVVLAVGFVLMTLAAKSFQETAASLQSSFDTMHGLFNQSQSIVADYQRRERERRDSK